MIAERSRGTTADSSPAWVGAARPFVLVADGEPGRARALASRLAERGCYAAVAASGNEALRYVAENEPDVVITDWDLPGLQGPELARRVRGAGHATGVLLLRADADWRVLRRTMECGGNDVLARPFTLECLFRSLFSCCPAGR